MAAALALTATACGSDSNSTKSATSNINCEAGAISGAGSTFVQTIAQQWVKDYAGACSGATVNYQGVGSGAGIQQFTAGTVDFAASDVALKPEERTAAEAKVGTVLQIPWAAGAIAVEYNVSGVTDLQLSGPTIAGIFAGKITKWDDAAIKADNPGKTLPSIAVQVVHRSDGSGTTAAFTAYMTAAAPDVWTLGSAKDVKWPVGQGAKGSDGVTAAIKAADGSIGYAELSFAKATGVNAAKVKNASNNWIAADADGAVVAALSEASIGADYTVNVNYAPKATQAYPISTVTYVVLPQSPANPAKAKLIKSFVMYAVDGGQASAGKLFYAALPANLAGPVTTAAGLIGTK